MNTSIISQRMKEKGFETDAALAAKVQCDRSMITRIKAGKVQPSLRIAVRLAKLLGLPPETFLNGDAA